MLHIKMSRSNIPLLNSHPVYIIYCENCNNQYNNMYLFSFPVEYTYFLVCMQQQQKQMRREVVMVSAMIVIVAPTAIPMMAAAAMGLSVEPCTATTNYHNS